MPPPKGYQFTQMLFGLHGALATFQWLMDRLLQPHVEYATAYLNNMVIYSRHWKDHFNHIAAVLRALREAGLMANPKDCHIGWQKTTYLRYTLGRGVVRHSLERYRLSMNNPPWTQSDKSGNSWSWWNTISGSSLNLPPS